MKMTIDDSRESALMSKEEVVKTLQIMEFGVQAFKRFNAKERETLDKAWNIIDQYEARLNADLVAILEELQLEIEELEKPLCHSATYAKGCVDKGKIEGLIQQKINKLKESKYDR